MEIEKIGHKASIVNTENGTLQSQSENVEKDIPAQPQDPSTIFYRNTQVGFKIKQKPSIEVPQHEQVVIEQKTEEPITVDGDKIETNQGNDTIFNKEPPMADLYAEMLHLIEEYNSNEKTEKGEEIEALKEGKAAFNEEGTSIEGKDEIPPNIEEPKEKDGTQQVNVLTEENPDFPIQNIEQLVGEVETSPAIEDPKDYFEQPSIELPTTFNKGILANDQVEDQQNIDTETSPLLDSPKDDTEHPGNELEPTDEEGKLVSDIERPINELLPESEESTIATNHVENVLVNEIEASTLVDGPKEVIGQQEPETSETQVDNNTVPIIQQFLKEVKSKIQPLKDKEEQQGQQSSEEEQPNIEAVKALPTDEELKRKRYYGIVEVASWFQVKTAYIRYLEKEFEEINPRKNGKGDRLFQYEDIKAIEMILFLMKNKKMNKESIKQYFKENKPGEDKKMDIIKSLEEVRDFLVSLKASLGQ